jgi:imidazolonepropionase-like amidohydrolase
MIILATMTLAPLLVASTLAQSTMLPAPSATQRQTVIEHATVHTAVAGQSALPDGFVVLQGDRIVCVGQGAPHVADGQPIDADAIRIDGGGKHITPAFISSATTLGLIEVQAVRATDDRSEFGPFHPEVSAWIAVNPDSSLFPVARLGGVLLAWVFPQGGQVCGESSLLRLNGWTNEQMTIVPDAGTFIEWPATEPAPSWYASTSAKEQERQRVKSLRRFDDFFDAAAAAIRARAADPSLPLDARYNSLADVLAGERPLLISAASTGQIESAVLWAIQRKIRPVIVGGQGAEAISDLLVKHQVPVIVLGTLQLPRFAHQSYDDSYTLPARLAARGIRVVIACGDEPSNDRNIAHHAAMAAAFGMPREEALAAITRNPAELCGVADRYGTIAAARSATLLLHSGDPFEVTSSVTAAWIDGSPVQLQSHQTLLRDKYERKYQGDATGAPQTAPNKPSAVTAPAMRPTAPNP